MPSPPPTPRDEAATAMTAEDVAQLFHETYERLAPDFGYQSAVAWQNVPELNRRLMVAVCRRVMATYGAAVCAVLATHIQQMQRDEQRLARQMYPKENREAGVNHWGAARGIERVLALLRDTTPQEDNKT